jgi:hypothetical protein
VVKNVKNVRVFEAEPCDEAAIAGSLQAAKAGMAARQIELDNGWSAYEQEGYSHRSSRRHLKCSPLFLLLLLRARMMSPARFPQISDARLRLRALYLIKGETVTNDARRRRRRRL